MASLLVGLFCLLVYNANWRSISAGDAYSARYLPFAIVQYHTVTMNPIARVAAQGRGGGAYWMVPLPDGRIMSLYPIVVPVLIAPLYLPAVAYLNQRGWTEARLDHVAKVMEKLSASILAAFSASLLYLLIRRRATEPVALLLTFAYAFGTTTWVISSQALWQCGMAQVLVIGLLLLLTAPCDARRTIGAGLLCGLIACNRPPDLVLAAALGAYGLFWAGRRRVPLLAAAAAFPVALVLIYNLRIFGNIGGGYGLIGKASFFKHSLFPGIGGLLFSPARGLLVFSPFLIFLVLAPWHMPKSRDERALTLVMTLAVAIQVLLYAKTDWRGGLSWGPRYMTDFLPFLILMLVPVLAGLRGAGRMVFRIAVGAAVAIEAIGAFSYVGSNDLPIYAIKEGPGAMDAAWKWRNAPFVSTLKTGLASPDLGIEMRGTFDAVEAGGRSPFVVTAGEEAVAAGWTLAGHRTPSHVGLIVDGGRKGFATSAFFDRPDVRATLNEESPAGWRIALDTSQLTPGEHSLTVMAWSSGKGEGQFVDERTLTVRSVAPTGTVSSSASSADGRPRPLGHAATAEDAELENDFRKAAARIREHQQADGYWPTAYTREMRFHEPHPEMNTFLTSLLIDLLDPVTDSSGLVESLQRGRRHLTRQIESDGLVRYHGLPDGPGIGTLGCVITPDTDDTALVWRLAPSSDRARLTTALSTIDRYRNSVGLYRTWLAPREAYQCVDPGRDPNPADIGIQLNLLLLLSEVRPPASRALCRVLQGSIDNADNWVYYRKAPLIPMLRMNDVHRAGCDLDLPERWMHTDVPGQAIWVDIARLRGRAASAGDSPPDAARALSMLRELAREDFLLLRTNPPLLYHNDLTASVSRYYWSEDVGYALWLRVYDEYELHGHPSLGG